MQLTDGSTWNIKWKAKGFFCLSLICLLPRVILRYQVLGALHVLSFTTPLAKWSSPHDPCSPPLCGSFMIIFRKLLHIEPTAEKSRQRGFALWDKPAIWLDARSRCFSASDISTVQLKVSCLSWPHNPKAVG